MEIGAGEPGTSVNFFPPPRGRPRYGTESHLVLTRRIRRGRWRADRGDGPRGPERPDPSARRV